MTACGCSFSAVPGSSATRSQSAALEQGWDVTTFNRGQSGPDVPGTVAIRGDRTRLNEVAQLASAGPWDAVVDTSGYVPRETLAVAELLEPVAGSYVFLSTVSVYRDWPVKPLSEDSVVLECPPDAGPDYGEDTEDGPTQYGYQKSGCEQAVIQTFGAHRSVILRPGVVLGPREYVGRLPWWLRRVADGGRVLAPGSPDRSIQPVDVRDLAAFALHAAQHELPGVYNVAAPIDRETFGGMLQACARRHWFGRRVRMGVRRPVACPASAAMVGDSAVADVPRGLEGGRGHGSRSWAGMPSAGSDGRRTPGRGCWRLEPSSATSGRPSWA